jgi:hypothetical protein
MIHIFKILGVLGKKRGYLSKKGFTIMLLCWLVHKNFIPNAQADIDKTKLSKEKKDADFIDFKF